MAALGSVIAAISIIVIIYAFMQKRKAGKIASLPFVGTGDAQAGKGAGDKGAISTYGKVVCAAPLTSPVTGTPCLYYELKVVGSWKDGDQNKTKDYIDEKHAAAFLVDDGSGGVAVHAAKGGDFETLKETFNQEQKEGFFADLKNAVGKGKPMMFGNYGFENPVNSKADKFRCIEKVMPLPESLFVAGKAASGAIMEPDGMFGSLILSPKSRDELMGSAAADGAKFQKFGLIGLGVGVVVGVIGNFMG